MPVADSDNLMGLGLPAQLANVIGARPNALTAAGTSQGAAAVMKSRNTELVTGASATGAIPISTAPLMEPYFITNQAATTAKVYVPSGHYLNSVQNASVDVAQYKSIIFWQYKKNYWTYILTA